MTTSPRGPRRLSTRVISGAIFGAMLAGAACSGPGPKASSPTPAGTRTTEAAVPRPRPETTPMPISLDEICRGEVTARARALPGKKPFTAADPHCTGRDPFCDHVETSPSPKDTCFVADDNIARAEREARGKGVVRGASTPWRGGTEPKYLDRIDAHVHFTEDERQLLEKNGFVVLDRYAYTDYATAFHDIFQQQLPLFVGVDPILHAVFRGTELALERAERKRLVPALASMLTKLRRGLGEARLKLDPETRGDLDVYLGVAWGLWMTPAWDDRPRPVTTMPGQNELASKLVADATRGELAQVTLFGRERMIDFSQLTPRGHYGSSASPDGSLEQYFRALMWLSRLEFNIVSRSTRSSHPGPGPNPAETPREVKAALALAELIERSGATEEVRAFEEVYTTFAGRREDIPPAKLLEIARTNRISWSDPDATDKLKVAIGDTYQRTARTHFAVEGAPILPAITTLFGPRIVPDVAPLTRLVHDAVLERKHLSAADVGYVLGHERARSYIRDVAAFPTLPVALASARDDLRRKARGAGDVYGMWLKAILATGETPSGVVPSFMQREAYADHRLNSALVGYGQLRHTFVLLAAQGYDAYGCEIPDAYVEPMPAVYDALLAHVRTMRSRAKGWGGLDRVLGTLAAIAHAETDGRILTEAQRRWLAMVSEHIPKDGFGDSGEPPKWTGWYFDMFDDREHGAVKGASFLADYFTLTNVDRVVYVGAEGPRLGVFVVDTNGEPRAMVGPVAKGFETSASISGRLDDQRVFEASVDKRAPWRASYAIDRREPALGLEVHVMRCEEQGEWRAAVRSASPAGPTGITLLDHHGDALTKRLTMDPKSTWSIAAFDLPPELAAPSWGVEGVHVHIDDLAPSHTGTGPYDFTTSPSHFSSWDHDEKMPERPRRTGSFAIGVPGGPSRLVDFETPGRGGASRY